MHCVILDPASFCSSSVAQWMDFGLSHLQEQLHSAEKAETRLSSDVSFLRTSSLWALRRRISSFFAHWGPWFCCSSSSWKFGRRDALDHRRHRGLEAILCRLELLNGFVASKRNIHYSEAHTQLRRSCFLATSISIDGCYSVGMAHRLISSAWPFADVFACFSATNSLTQTCNCDRGGFPVSGRFRGGIVSCPS